MNNTQSSVMGKNVLLWNILISNGLLVIVDFSAFTRNDNFLRLYYTLWMYKNVDKNSRDIDVLFIRQHFGK